MRFVLFILVISHFSGFDASAELPSQPNGLCERDTCTEKMTAIYDGFQNNPQAPELVPQVYSGDCYFKSRDFNPHKAHRAMVFLDQHPTKDQFYFASGFRFFGAPDGYADWDVPFTREKVKGAWDNYGPMETQDNTTRIVSYSNDGSPAFVYYLRQDPLTKKIYYITYWGNSLQISFCEMLPNNEAD